MTTTTLLPPASARKALGRFREPDLDGYVLRPGQAGYDEARQIWNAMVDHHPAVVVRCASVRDVVAAVRLARDLNLELGVRCGGHSAVGHAVPDGGLMVDLSLMGGVRVDAGRRRAVVQGGALLGALDAAAQRHGLATTAGNVSHTGVGGLTLGGGMGWLARQYGLACDNVAAYQVVTADGEVVRVTAHEHPNLFWALRGGGGNFGIVTAFEFRLHPIGTDALTVEVDFPAGQAAEVLCGWRDLSESAPRQATYTADLGSDLLTVGYVWVGPGFGRRRDLAAVRALGQPVGERVINTTYLTLQTRSDTVGGHHYRRYAKGHYFRDLTDQAITALTSVGAPPFPPQVSLQAYGGAIDDIADDEAAFSHRGTRFELGASARWSDPDEDADRIGAARDYAATLTPHASGAYVNALGADEGSTGVRRAYTPDKLRRLIEVKRTYDPYNVFHLNHNIAPGQD